MSVLPNLIYILKAIPIKNAAIFFIDVDKLILKFVWRDKIPRTAHKILRNRVGRQTLLDLKTCCKVVVIK